MLSFSRSTRYSKKQRRSMPTDVEMVRDKEGKEARSSRLLLDHENKEAPQAQCKQVPGTEDAAIATNVNREKLRRAGSLQPFYKRNLLTGPGRYESTHWEKRDTSLVVSSGTRLPQPSSRGIHKHHQDERSHTATPLPQAAQIWGIHWRLNAACLVQGVRDPL